MKKTFFILLMASIVVSCKSLSIKNNEGKSSAPVSNSQEEEVTAYFKAAGNEPFWALQIGKEKVVFTSMIEGSEKLTFSAVEPIKAMDANVKMYRLTSSNASATVTVQQMDCQDSMSGELSPYKVTVEIKNNAETNSKTLQGCGRYITDYRLHDIWVLEELNGKKITVSDAQRELPRIEIHAAENQFMGFGGCNSISGSLFYEKDLLRFTNVISTLMACAPGNIEDEFITALQSTTTYSIGNNKLILSNPSGKLLVFKKVD